MQIPSPAPDFSWLRPDMLQPGDILLVSFIMPEEYRASMIFQRQIFKHSALVIDHDLILDVRVPYSKLISLKKFLKPCSQVTVVRLRKRPLQLRENLKKFAQSRINEQFGLWMVGYAVAFFIVFHYFKFRLAPSQLAQTKQKVSGLVRFGQTFYGCSTAIYQAWLQYIPEIRPAFQKFYAHTQVPIFTPDPQYYFIQRNPDLFEVINPPPKEEVKLIDQMYTPIPQSMAYNPLEKQKNFLNHGRLLLFLSGLVQKLIYNKKVPAGLKEDLKEYKRLIQRAAQESIAFAMDDSVKGKLMKTGRAIMKRMEFVYPLDPNFSVQREIKEMEEEMEIACKPRARL